MRRMPKKRSEVESAERIHSDLTDKRDEQNLRASELREERDTVHEKKRELIEKMTKLKEERDALTVEMKRHKERRNEFQSKGRALVERKRSVTRRMDRGLPSTIEELKLEIKELELHHQTQPSTIYEERDLLDMVRRKEAELRELEARSGDEEDLTLQAESLDGMIDEAFKKADEEHEEVVRLHDEAEKVHERVVVYIEEINHLAAEGDKKHHAFLEARALADRYHQKAVEMRSKLMTSRREEREEREREQKEMDELNLAVQERFESEEAKKKAEEEVLKILQEKGRVNIKR